MQNICEKNWSDNSSYLFYSDQCGN